MQWAKAWMGKTPPPAGVIGFGYMLRGGSDASNTDPHAEAPATGAKWVDTGPHVMVLNVGDAAKTYPRQGEKHQHARALCHVARHAVGAFDDFG